MVVNATLKFSVFAENENLVQVFATMKHLVTNPVE